MKSNQTIKILFLFIVIALLITACGGDSGKTQLIRNKKIVDKTTTTDQAPEEKEKQPEPEQQPEEPTKTEPKQETKQPESNPEPEPAPEPEAENKSVQTDIVPDNSRQDLLNQLNLFNADKCSVDLEVARENMFTRWLEYIDAWHSTIDEEEKVFKAEVEVDVAEDELDEAKDTGTQNQIDDAEDRVNDKKDDLDEARRDRDQKRDAEDTASKALENARKLFEDKLNICESEVQTYVQTIISDELYTPETCHDGLLELRILKDAVESDYDEKDKGFLKIISEYYQAAQDELKEAEETESDYTDDEDKRFAKIQTDVAEIRERNAKSDSNRAGDYFEDVKDFIDTIDEVKKRLDSECGSLERAGRTTTKTMSECQTELDTIKDKIDDLEQDVDEKKSDVTKYTNDILNLYEDLFDAQTDMTKARVDQSGESSAESKVENIWDDIRKNDRWRWSDLREQWSYQDKLDEKEKEQVLLRDACGK